MEIPITTRAHIPPGRHLHFVFQTLGRPVPLEVSVVDRHDLEAEAVLDKEGWVVIVLTHQRRAGHHHAGGTAATGHPAAEPAEKFEWTNFCSLVELGPMKLPSAERVAAALRRPQANCPKLSRQLKQIVVDRSRLTPTRQAQLLRLARELESLGL